MSSDPVPAPSRLASDGERLSAWLDGELDKQQSAVVMAEMLQRGSGRRQFEEWCLVGDALRSSEVAAGHSPRLCARVAQALQDEPALLAPRALGVRTRRNLATGFAVAAAAAVVLLVAVPQLRTEVTNGAVTGGQIARAPGVTADLASAVAPGSAVAARNGRNPRLDPYIQAHRDFSGVGVMPAAAVYLRSGNEGEP